jgi:hypothetical protein
MKNISQVFKHHFDVLMGFSERCTAAGRDQI